MCLTQASWRFTIAGPEQAEKHVMAQQSRRIPLSPEALEAIERQLEASSLVATQTTMTQSSLTGRRRPRASERREIRTHDD